MCLFLFITFFSQLIFNFYKYKSSNILNVFFATAERLLFYIRALNYIQRGFNSPRVSRGCLFSALSPYTMRGQLARQTPILRTNTLSRTSLSQQVYSRQLSATDDATDGLVVITAIISRRSHLAQLIPNVFIRDTLSLSREQGTAGRRTYTRSRPFSL